MQRRNRLFPTQMSTAYRVRAARFLASFIMALCLLWIASPALMGQVSEKGRRMADLQKQLYSRRHLQALNYALLQYTADNDGHLPALDAPAKLRKQLAPYKFTGGMLICPVAEQPYRGNPNLAGKKLKSVPNPSKTLLFWSPRATSDGYTYILDADGLNRRVTGGELAQMKRASRVQ